MAELGFEVGDAGGELSDAGFEREDAVVLVGNDELGHGWEGVPEFAREMVGTSHAGPWRRIA